MQILKWQFLPLVSLSAAWKIIPGIEKEVQGSDGGQRTHSDVFKAKHRLLIGVEVRGQHRGVVRKIEAQDDVHQSLSAAEAALTANSLAFRAHPG